MKIGTVVRNAMVDSAVDLIDAGAGAGTIEIRTGAPPTNVADADSGTLLATLTMTDPAFGSSATGTATANSITSDTNVDASGTAGHFRIKDSNAVSLFQGTCGTSGADLNFNTVTFVAGGTCAISSLTMTQPVGT
jgi:hypothetical protein